MVEDDRPLLVGVRPDRSTALLQEQAKRFRRAQQDRHLNRRKIEALAHQIAAGQDLHAAILECLQDSIPLSILHTPVNVAGCMAGVAEVLGHILGVLDAHAERNRLLARRVFLIVPDRTAGDDWLVHRILQLLGNEVSHARPHRAQIRRAWCIDNGVRQEALSGQLSDCRPHHHVIEHLPHTLAVKALRRGCNAQHTGGREAGDDLAPTTVRREVMRLVANDQVERLHALHAPHQSEHGCHHHVGNRNARRPTR